MVVILLLPYSNAYMTIQVVDFSIKWPCKCDDATLCRSRQIFSCNIRTQDLLPCGTQLFDSYMSRKETKKHSDRNTSQDKIRSTLSNFIARLTTPIQAFPPAIDAAKADRRHLSRRTVEIGRPVADGGHDNVVRQELEQHVGDVQRARVLRVEGGNQLGVFAAYFKKCWSLSALQRNWWRGGLAERVGKKHR